MFFIFSVSTSDPISPSLFFPFTLLLPFYSSVSSFFNSSNYYISPFAHLSILLSFYPSLLLLFLSSSFVLFFSSPPPPYSFQSIFLSNFYVFSFSSLIRPLISSIFSLCYSSHLLYSYYYFPLSTPPAFPFSVTFLRPELRPQEADSYSWASGKVGKEVSLGRVYLLHCRLGNTAKFWYDSVIIFCSALLSWLF
jgi:hypothetical protein